MKTETLDVDVVLLCGGKGTRLRDLTGEKLPKSLYKLREKELIDYTLDNLSVIPVKNAVFAVDHKSKNIVDWVKKRHLPYVINFSYQTQPGILAAVKSAMKYTDSPIIVICNTDEIRLGLNLRHAIEDHIQSGRLATMVTTTSSSLFRHRVIEITERYMIKKTYLKQSDYLVTPSQRGLINTGMIIINRDASKMFKGGIGSNWGSIIDRLVENSVMGVYIEYGMKYFNVGTPQEAFEAQHYLLDLHQAPRRNLLLRRGLGFLRAHKHHAR